MSNRKTQTRNQNNKNNHSPHIVSTRSRKRYPIILLILLLGTTQAPSHFPVTSSTTAQIGNPILLSLSWPSADQRSLMPAGVFGNRNVFLELGPLLRKPSGLCVCITDDTRERGRQMFWSQVICALIIAGPWFCAGSLSTCLRIICSLTCAGMLQTVCDLLPWRPSCWRRHLMVLVLPVDKTIC